MSPNGNAFVLMPGFCLWAFGASIGFPAVNIAAVAGTKPGEEGLASGIVSTSGRVGFPVGLAILLTVAGIFDPVPGPQASPTDVANGIVAGFRAAIVAATLLGVLGFTISLGLKDTKPQWDQTMHKPTQPVIQ
jgi:hypothetical protein